MSLSLILEGCAVVSTGHRVDLEKVDGFKPGLTTPAQVEAALGAPENVTRNTVDNTVVYTYQWVRNSFLGIGLPPWIVLGRKKDTGFLLNVAFLGGTFRGYTLTDLRQRLLGRTDARPEAEAAARGGAIPPERAPDKTTDAFTDAQRVRINGYDGVLMEPFITADGEFLFFNNNNDPAEKTDLYAARRVNDALFEFIGPLKGANAAGHLEGVPSMDRQKRFYFTTTRDYAKTFRTIYAGTFTGRDVVNVKPVAGDYSHDKPHWVTMDVEVSHDGGWLYISDAYFRAFAGAPSASDLILARRGADGAFNKVPDSEKIFEKINTPELEYAPCISADGRELFFTRLFLKTLKTQILRARRGSLAEPFGEPEVLTVATGFVEAPTLTADGKTLYYHKKEGGGFSLYKATRQN